MGTIEGDEAHAALRERIAELEAELESCRNAVEKMRQAWMVANNDRKALTAEE